MQLLRDLGSAVAPFNAWLIAQGLETLSLRIERHVDNAQAVAEWLTERDEVRRASTTPACQQSLVRTRHRSTHPAALVPCWPSRSTAACRGWQDVSSRRLQLHSHVANIGDVRSLVIHPASTTHSQFTRRGATDCGCYSRTGSAWPSGWRTSTTSSPTSRSVPRRQVMTDPQPPVRTGYWRPGDDPGQRLFVDVGPIELDLGGSLPEVTVAYQTWGQLNADRSNAVLILHALTGDSHVTGPAGPGHPTPGWWSEIVGPGKVVDTDEWFVVASNVLGGCQGTTGPSSLAPDGRPWGSRWMRVTVRDQVVVEARLADYLGIDKFAAVIGGSMGGLRALEWLVMYPQRVGSAAILACGAAATADQIGTQTVQIQAVTADPKWAKGDFYDEPAGPPLDGLEIARRIAHLTYRTEHELAVRFGNRTQEGEDAFSDDAPGVTKEAGRFAVTSYLDHQGAKLARRFDAGTYLSNTDAMSTHDVGRGRGGAANALAQVDVPVEIGGISSDRLYPLYLQQELVDLIPTAPRLRVVESDYGHDGFLLESEAVAEIISDLLERSSKNA